MPMNIDLPATIEAGREILRDAATEVTQTLELTYNAIIDIWEIDCQGQWIVWVQTGLIAVGHALWLILTPSIEEILESYLQPKSGRRGGRRGRSGERERRVNPSGQRRVFFGGGVPDLDNMIADSIPGREIIAGRRLAPGEFIFWTGVQVLDRVAWQWLLLEATQTFATEWQSGLMKSEKCGSMNNESCEFTVLPRTDFGVPIMWGGLTGIDIAYSEHMRIGAISLVSIGTPGTEGHAMIICAAIFTLDNTLATGPTSIPIQVEFSAQDNWGNTLGDTVETATITAAPGAIAIVRLDAVARKKKWASSFFRFIVSGGTSGGTFTLTAEASISLAVRSVYFV